MQEANTLEAKKGEVLKKGREKTKAPRAFFRSPFHPLVVAYVYRTTDKKKQKRVLLHHYSHKNTVLESFLLLVRMEV